MKKFQTILQILEKAINNIKKFYLLGKIKLYIFLKYLQLYSFNTQWIPG